MRSPRKPAARIAAAALLTSLTHATLAQSPEAVERARGVSSAIEQQLSSAPGREMYIMTDKPLYHPGEAVWFRAWEVSVKSLAATPGDHGVTFQLIDPRGAKVAEKRVQSRGGMSTNDFILAPSLPGGQYTLRAQSELGITETRDITVSTYEVPRLKKTAEFTRKSYAPGDGVTALINIEKATGEPLTGARVTAAVAVDGNELARFVVAIDARGSGVVRFQLPPHIRKGDGLLTVTADAGGISETLQKRIPIVLDQVTVQLFPEGGDLITGLPSRVYLMAQDNLGQPAEVEGKVIDDQGTVIAPFKSFHAGMARFPLTPQPGRTYSVKLSRPGTSAHALPAARPAGCALRAEDDFTSKNNDVRVSVACTQPTKLVLAATLREKLLASVPVETSTTDPVSASLTIPAGSIGAVRVTLFDADKNPLAERLVYRGLGQGLRVAVTSDQKEYTPRDKVTLTVKTTDASGAPVSADVALSVVDDSVLRFADSKAPNMLADLYLQPEMPGQKIFEPNFYFSGDPKAPEALDLLLGTQGWRRFAWKWVQR